MEKKMNKQKNEKISVFEKVKAKVSFRDIKTQNNLNFFQIFMDFKNKMYFQIYMNLKIMKKQ